MNSPDVAAALYAGAPDAAGQLYDAHAEALFQYSWLTLRNRQHAQTVVTDALVQAGARVAELSDPGTPRAWLFTLARAEGHRHPLPSLGDTDQLVARPEQQDAALRIMAWNSVMSLDLVERQALDLNTRHGMTAAEVSLILALPLPGVTELLACAKVILERALGAEILVSRDGQECPGRTEAIHGWTGTVTPAFRDRLLKHAASCPLCQPRLPRNVSPSRIFGLLPAPALDPEVRGQVIEQVMERVQAQAAELEPDPQPKPPLSTLAPSEPVIGTLGRSGPGVSGPGAPTQSQPVLPDPVEPDPVEPDPVVPDPAANLDARPDEPPVEHHEPPKQVATPELDVLPFNVVDHSVHASPRRPRPPAPPRPAPSQGHRSAPKPKKKRRGIRLFAGLGAAILALGIAAGLTYGSLSTSRAQLSGAVSRDVLGGAGSAQAGGGPLPSPYAPSPTPRSHDASKKSAQISPAAGHADAVASDKTGNGNRAITTRGQGTHQTVTVVLRPSASSSSHTQAAARLTATPANLGLGINASGTVTLSVSGGPMSWTASPSSGVTVSPASGHLGNSGRAVVTISVLGQRSTGGSGVVSIDGDQVSVTWSATAIPSSQPSGSQPSGGSPAPSDPSSPPRHNWPQYQPDAGGSPDPSSS